MSKFNERRAALLANPSGVPVCPAAFKEKYPATAIMFEGVVSPNQALASPAYKLGFYTTEEGLGHCWRSADGKESWFGTPTADPDVLGHVEQCILLGKLTLKREREPFGGTKPTH